MATEQPNVLPFMAEKISHDNGPALVASEHSLLEIDREIDLTLDLMQDDLEEKGEISNENRQRFENFCEAFGQKVDRIGRFLRVMETRETYCKSEAARLTERARSSERKVAQTKSLVLYFLESRALSKMEGHQFTLRRQKNSVDTVRIQDPANIPIHLRRVEAKFDGELWEQIAEALPERLRRPFVASVSCSLPANEALRQAIAAGVAVDGVTVTRGHHLRIS